MRVEYVETVARMAALVYHNDPEKGYRKAKEHTLDHLKIVSQHWYVVENDDKQVIAAMVLHSQSKIFM
jgi:polyphosphate kinase 2 (PPK2 family)